MTVDEALKIGRAALGRGDDAQAESMARQILRDNPNELRALDLLGHVALQRRKHDEAARIYQQAVKVAPDAATMHHNLALALLHENDAAGAERHYRRSLQLGVNRAEAHD